MEKNDIEIVRELVRKEILSGSRQASRRYLYGEERQTGPSPPHQSFNLEPSIAGKKMPGSEEVNGIEAETARGIWY